MAALSKESSETTTKIEAMLVHAVKYETVSRSRPSYRLVGLVVRHPPRERKIPGSNPTCDVDFFGVESRNSCAHITLYAAMFNFFLLVSIGFFTVMQYIIQNNKN